MAADIPTIEPSKHQAGTTLKFKRSLPDFPADTWTLTYELRSNENAPLTITASTDGNNYSINEAYSTTANWNAGEYLMTGYVTSATERHQVYQAAIEITPYTAGKDVYQWRTFAEQMVAKAKLAIEGRIERTEISYSINGRSFTAKSDEDLYKALAYWENKVALEKTKGRNRKILVRFRNAR